jgi:AraC family transcriptional regulator of adaptative response/methylated-DNA-[protein]-cysteine methyltransferase
MSSDPEVLDGIPYMTDALERPIEKEMSLDDEARWAAVVARDRSHDGEFYYSVATTGVYCRPSCPARRAKRAIVRFHATNADAEAAGFRPCKRCRPDRSGLQEQRAATIADACRLIEGAEDEPRLEKRAQTVGLSPYYFHRLFKSVTGVTPKADATAQRQKSIREKLGRACP